VAVALTDGSHQGALAQQHCPRPALRPCAVHISGARARRQLRDHARAIPGKAQLFINAFAKALEVIPRQLCDNSGFDATDVLNKLRQKHALKDGSGRNFGVDVNTGAPPRAHQAAPYGGRRRSAQPCRQRRPAGPRSMLRRGRATRRSPAMKIA